MRLWHKNLIKVLPKEQLVAQWREVSAIAGSIIKNGTPNHLLVNKVLNYDFDHFITYSKLVKDEMTARGYRTTSTVWDKIVNLEPSWKEIPINELFPNWHTGRYLKQCYYNLEEKYDCGGISLEDWAKIEKVVLTTYV